MFGGVDDYTLCLISKSATTRSFGWCWKCRDTARLWTTLTAAAIGPEAVASLPAMIPDHAYFPLYGPDFRMATRHKLIPDRNDEAYLTKCVVICFASSFAVHPQGCLCLALLEHDKVKCIWLWWCCCGEVVWDASRSMIRPLRIQ